MMKEILKNHKNIMYKVQEFSNLAELNFFILNKKIQKNFKNHETTIRDAEWAGVPTLEQAHRMMMEGWEDGLREFKSIIKGAKGTPKNKMCYDVVGYVPCVPLALSNVPNCMIADRKQPSNNKVISIVYDNVAAVKVKARDLMEAGKNIVNVIKNLEMKGYRVEFKTAVSLFQNWTNQLVTMLVDLKDSMQPMNLKKFMYPMCHPSWLRVIGFQWQERATNTYQPGRGRPIYASWGDIDREYYNSLLGNEAYYLTYNEAKKGEAEILKILGLLK